MLATTFAVRWHSWLQTRR